MKRRKNVYGPRSITVGKFHFVLYSFFFKHKPGLRVWFDFTFGGDWFTFIWWKKSKSPVFYRSPDATPPTSRNPGKYYIGSFLDTYPR
jgi:hypothetical protein